MWTSRGLVVRIREEWPVVLAVCCLVTAVFMMGSCAGSADRPVEAAPIAKTSDQFGMVEVACQGGVRVYVLHHIATGLCWVIAQEIDGGAGITTADPAVCR